MYGSNLSALTAAGDAMGIIAHNIANMNTDGYRPISFTYDAGPADTVRARADVGCIELPRQPVGAYPLEDRPGYGPYTEAVAPSGTDVAREMVAMISAENLFAANAATIVSREATGDTVLGLVVDRRA